jgi:Na+/H+-dicarboxylate symporter
MSETIYTGIFTKLVTSNIFVSFHSGNFAAIAFFAIFFGFALGKVLQQHRIAETESSVMRLFRELDKVFILLINWVILATPFAVFSLIAKAIGRNSNLRDNFTNVGYLVAATILAMFLHYCVFYLGVFWLFTRMNVFKYMKCLVPAQTMAFASASSAATIPVTLRSVMDTGIVPEAIARFVIPLGATINMDGGAIYL